MIHTGPDDLEGHYFPLKMPQWKSVFIGFPKRQELRQVFYFGIYFLETQGIVK